MKRINIGKELYYITHIDNIPSILKQGILSHDRIEAERIPYTPIYDAQIVADRRERKAPNGKNLGNFANVYFQPRNPMLYRVLCEKSPNDIAVIAVQGGVMKNEDAFITTGGAANSLSEILPFKRDLLARIRDDIDKEWWSELDGSKRKIMAETLVPDVITPELIRTIYVANHDVATKLKADKRISLPIIPEPVMFFQPLRTEDLTPTLSIVEGDMFFSRTQTLTVSVNCVGVMGKGLASRAKYQFPDVYVRYQDLCRKKTLRMGKPYLHKRETPLDHELADEPSTLTNANLGTGFLLFPTKRHWRDRADIRGIENGLKWLQDNYEREGIESLAIPALGCGLGWLKWHKVGPLISRYLSNLNIPTRLYLPTERKVSRTQLTRDFLLG